MNKVIAMGRLTRDPKISWNEENLCIARYALAVDRKYRKDGEQGADFISCVTFGKGAEFADKYFEKGTKILIEGRVQTGNYVRDDGIKVYTTEVVVEHQEFAESVRRQR